MVDTDLLTRCHVNTNEEGDTFVGIKTEGGNLSVCFPLGYSLPTDDKELRRDVLNLIMVLSKFSDMKDRMLPQQRMLSPQIVKFPIQAYMTLISQYMSSGYYTENEVRYKENQRGKISWARTIKKQKPLPQAGSFVYLDYVVKYTNQNNESLISLIHEYCVYESFLKLGWLYTSSMPQQPRIRFDKRMFLSTVYNKLSHTFNDKHKEVFNSMIAMINYLGNKGIAQQFYFGTNRFEYVWERLIDFTFGVDAKEQYFPKTVWHLSSGRNKDNAALEPDTVMIVGDRIFVLDAKYYKYGMTAIPYHLPESTSINKQITYGEYIATQARFKRKFGENYKIYNSFLMPFSKGNGYFETSANFKHIGEATGTWKNGGNEYERVQGILIDVRHLMHNFVRRNKEEILRLSLLIEEAVTRDASTTTSST